MIISKNQPLLPTFSWAASTASDGSSRFHTHDAAELIYINSGHSTIDVGVISLEGFAGDLYILPANVSHNQRCHEPTHRIYVIFHAPLEWLDDSPRVVDLHGDKWIPRWFEDLRDMCLAQSEPAQFDQCAQGLLIATLHRMSAIENRTQHHKRLHPALAASIQWIAHHLSEEITLDTLAEKAGLSASHLTALFRESLDISPMKYLQNQRMILAKKLLIDPYQTISQISLLCGYSDANYFTRLFRKHHNCCPTEYRHKHIK